MQLSNRGKRDAGPNALRRGRVSIPHADYFVSVCALPRLPILLPRAATALLDEAHRLTADGHWALRCATMMPDHSHLLFTLGERLTLPQTIARLKTKVQPLIRAAEAEWQGNFYDHRLRPGDSVERVIRYIYLNPHQAGLVRPDEQWPFFYCRPEDWEWFRGTIDDGQSFPEWLQ